MDAVVSVRGLKKSYGAVEAVAGIDLEVEKAEVFAFLGPNGAGKTTTVEILEGFRPRTSGEVRVLGQDPAAAGAAWRDKIGVVLQESQPEPATRSLTVPVTSTSAGPASAITREPMCTAIPPSFPSISSHSPVWTPQRTSTPSCCTAWTIAAAASRAGAGSEKVAKNPSPAVSISRPRQRSSSLLTSA